MAYDEETRAFLSRFDAPRPKQDDETSGFLSLLDGASASVSQPSKRSGSDLASDAGSQLAKGVNTVAGAIPNLIAPGSAVAEFFNDNAQYWEGKQSGITKALSAAADSRIEEAAKGGMWDAFVAGVREYGSEPALVQKLILENVPSLIPGVAAAKGAQAASLAKNAAAIEQGILSARAAQKAGIAAGATAGGAANATLNAGGARQDSFQDWKSTLIAQGLGEDEATIEALSRSWLAAGVGGATGALSGATGLERGILGAAGRGGAKGFAQKAATEVAGEQIEELGPQLATNLQIQDVDPSRSPTHELGKIAAQTLVASGPGGLVAGTQGMQREAANTSVEDLARPTPESVMAPIMESETVEEAIAAAASALDAVHTAQVPSEAELALDRQHSVDYAPVTPPETEPEGTVDADLVGNEIDFDRPAALGILDEARGLPTARDELAAELQREPAPLEPPAIEIPGAPAAATSIPPARTTREEYADALVKSQRGEVLSTYERVLLDNPPETPAIAVETASRSKAARDPATMSMRELDMAAKLTRSPERRSQLTAELEQRAAARSASMSTSVSAAAAVPKGARTENGVGTDTVSQRVAANAVPTSRAGAPVNPPWTAQSNVEAAWVGRVDFPTSELPQSVAPRPSPGPESRQPSRQPLEVQTAGDQSSKPGLIDFMKQGESEPRTFRTERLAAAYAKQKVHRVPAEFAPRQTSDGWVLSRPAARDSTEPMPTLRADAGGLERRVDAQRRRHVADMTHAEMHAALLTDEMTGLGNSRAYAEAPRKAVQAAIDADSLKWINDSFGHQAGNELLSRIGDALRDAGVTGYRTGGDEFVAEFDSADEAEATLQRVAARLGQASITVTAPDGTTLTKKGLQFTHGLGSTLEEADVTLRREKLAREQRGERAARGAEPPGVDRKPAVQARQAGVPPPAEVETKGSPYEVHGTQDRRGNSKRSPSSPSAADPASPNGVRYRSGDSVRGLKWLARGITDHLQQEGATSLVGRVVTSPEDLAELAQVYRNPRVETFRVFFTKADTIVHATGVSARLPGMTPAFPDNLQGDEGFAWVQNQMNRVEADGYWLQHNHPSGLPTPSDADMNLTKAFARAVPGLRAHIVINHNAFAVIDDQGRYTMEKRDMGAKNLHEPALPHELLGREIRGPDMVANLAWKVQRTEWITLLAQSLRGVQGIAEIHVSEWKHPARSKAAIRAFARRTGSPDVFAYGKREDIQTAGIDHLEGLIEDRFLRDVVWGEPGERVSSLLSSTTPRYDRNFGPVSTRAARERETAYPGPGRGREPAWISAGSEALRSAAAKIDTYAPTKSMQEKARAMSANWKERLVQGMFDAYAPLKRLGWSEYVKARMVKSADGALEGMLLFGKPVMGEDGAIHGDIDRKGFLGAMKELQGEHDRFLMWVAGSRAAQLMVEERENLFTDKEIAAMRGLAAGKMRDGSPRPQAYAKAAGVLNAYNAAVLDIAQKTGLIDAEARKLWVRDHYIPFFRIGDDSTIEGPSTRVKGLARQQAFQRLKGGRENLGDLMANTLGNWSHLLSASLANQAAAASLKAAVKAGIAREVPAGTRGATFAMVEGKKVFYEVDDAFVLTAISAMESASFQGLPMELMGKFKHYLTLGVTVSPTFRVRNLMRDTLSAIGQNEMSYNILENLAKGYRGTDRKSDQYAQMLFSGGLMRFGQLTDGKHAEHAKRLIAAGVSDETILTNPEKVKAALGNLWDRWQEFGDRMENVNRAALYAKLKSEGKSDLEAAFAARDMLDFSLQGSWMAVRMLTQVVPFMNARLQGLYKMGRAAHQNPARLGYVAGAVSLASIALMLAYQDDDEWKRREDWDRDAFWWFRVGDTAYRIPKPFELGALGTLAERSVELMISDEMGGKRFAERMQSMVMDTFALNPVPQLFKPMLDLYANTDSFTGRQIESRALQGLTKAERLTPGSSLVARALGKAGNVTGVSPVQVDHMIRAYFGWLGTHAAITVDLMAQPFLDGEKPARKIGDVFVLGDFVKDLPANRSRYVEEFYKQAKTVHEVMGDLRRAREVHDLERVKEILEDKGAKVALASLYNAAERRLGEISREIRMVQATGRSAEEKRLRLDQLTAMRHELARAVDERARQAREVAGQSR